MDDTASHSVLIADDDEFLRDTLAELLDDSGYTLLFSTTAKETWEIVALKRPDLVLLDIRFPDCRDLSLLKRIREGAPDTAIIVISSQTDDVSQIVEATTDLDHNHFGVAYLALEPSARLDHRLSFHLTDSWVRSEVRQPDCA